MESGGRRLPGHPETPVDCGLLSSIHVPPARPGFMPCLQCPAAVERPIDRGTRAALDGTSGAALFLCPAAGDVIEARPGRSRVDNRSGCPNTLPAICEPPPSSSGLGHRLFMSATGVRIPLGVFFRHFSPGPAWIASRPFAILDAAISESGICVFRVCSGRERRCFASAYA